MCVCGGLWLRDGAKPLGLFVCAQPLGGCSRYRSGGGGLMQQSIAAMQCNPFPPLCATTPPYPYLYTPPPPFPPIFPFSCTSDLDGELDLLQGFTWEELLATEVGTKDVQVGWVCTCCERGVGLGVRGLCLQV